MLQRAHDGRRHQTPEHQHGVVPRLVVGHAQPVVPCGRAIPRRLPGRQFVAAPVRNHDAYAAID